MKFLVTIKDGEEEYTTPVNGDVILTKPFGLVIVSTDKKKESFFSSKLWKSIEMGDYTDALSKTNERNTKIKIDGEKEYIVSKVEFDNNGSLTLTISKENEKLWVLILAPSTFGFFISNALR